MVKFEQLAEEKKLRIINAALDEFGSKGYRAASTNEIAKAAAISKGSLFHYFGSKEKLFLWLQAYAAGVLEKSLYQSRIFDKENFIESLTAAAILKLKVIRTYPALKTFTYKTCMDKDLAITNLDGTFSLSSYLDFAAARVDQNRFRSELTLEEALQVAGWVLDGMTRDYFDSGLPLEDENIEVLKEKMLTMLKKLIYKEDYI